jgi:hypothetical protein
MKDKHTVHIVLKDGNPAPLSADGARVETKLLVNADDEIRWVSDAGTVEVAFHEATPFAGGVKHGDGTFRPVGADGGSFRYVCTVTTPDGKKHGWPESSVGGGTVEVGTGSRSGKPE